MARKATEDRKPVSRAKKPADAEVVEPAASEIVPADKPLPFEVNGIRLSCTVCKSGTFWSKRILLNTRGLTYMQWDWLNRDALTVICSSCGFVHWFVTD